VLHPPIAYRTESVKIYCKAQECVHFTDLLAVADNFVGSVDVIQAERIEVSRDARPLNSCQSVHRRKRKLSRALLTHLGVVTLSSFRQACQGCTCMATRIPWSTQSSKLLIVEHVAIVSQCTRNIAGV
jgi:hypothetical protein